MNVTSSDLFDYKDFYRFQLTPAWSLGPLGQKVMF